MSDAEKPYASTCHYCQQGRSDCLPFITITRGKTTSEDVCAACRWVRTIRGPGGPKRRDKVQVEKIKAVVDTLTDQKARAEDRLDYESRLGSLLAYCEEKGRAEALGEAIELLEAVINDKIHHCI